MPSIAVQMVQANGSRSANVPLSSSRPTIMSNSSSPGHCHIALPKSSIKQKVSLEPVSGSSRALFRDCLNPQSSPKVLSVNDEFVMAGKTFRVVSMAEGGNEERFVSTPTVAQSKLQQRKATPFVAHNKGGGVAFHRDVSSPAVPKMHQRPKATPFVSSSSRVQFFDGNSPVSTLAPQFKLQASSASPVAPLPKSVLKFMASRAAASGKAAPAVTRGASITTKPPAVAAAVAAPAMVVAAPQPVVMRLAPTPLRVQIQQEGQRLNLLRSQLLDRLEDFGLEVERYKMWTVYQLEQRVEALEMELQRASVEALLVEAGYDPKEFEQYDADEIEQWLEEEISALEEDDEEEEEEQPQRVATAYRGKITEFASPAAVAAKSFIQNSPAVPEPSFVTNHHSVVYEEQPAFIESSELDGSPSFILQEQQQKGMFDEEESMLSPIAKRQSTVAHTPYSVKKLVTTPYFKRVAAEEMTCEKIRAELKFRGLKVGGLKSVIAERLADALENEARDQGLEVMEVTGHDYLGREVVRVFEGTGESHGVIEAWAPPPVGQVDESLAKFRVVHDNGEVELLNLTEIEQALV
ncbi:hypothetical protein BASA81_003963 [Batrachochytrium salamandrivorans]|nr:hypothetical protein BASA81_003963 [Batrachochytrium salamandrivorans]